MFAATVVVRWRVKTRPTENVGNQAVGRGLDSTEASVAPGKCSAPKGRVDTSHVTTSHVTRMRPLALPRLWIGWCVANDCIEARSRRRTGSRIRIA